MMSQMMCCGQSLVYDALISNRTVEDIRTGGTTASVDISIYTWQDGGEEGVLKYYTSAGGFASVAGEWLTGDGTPADYEVQYTFVSGDTPGGLAALLAGNWISCDQSGNVINATLGASSGQDKTAVFTLSIRNATTLEVYTTATITLHAQSIP